jgi:hypothetical protein
MSVEQINFGKNVILSPPPNLLRVNKSQAISQSHAFSSSFATPKELWPEASPEQKLHLILNIFCFFNGPDLLHVLARLSK